MASQVGGLDPVVPLDSSKAAAQDGTKTDASMSSFRPMAGTKTDASTRVAGTPPQYRDVSGDIVPVEWFWVFLRGEATRSFSRQLVFYVIFILLFGGITQMVRPVSSTFAVQDTIIELTARQPFPSASWDKTFYHIKSDEEWYEWVETVLLPTTLSTEYFNGDSRAAGWGGRFMNTVSMYNTQTARVRFRQAQVREDTCDTPNDSGLSRPCWGAFTAGRQRRDAYGEDFGNQFLTGLNSVGGKSGFGPGYGDEAHVVDAPLQRSESLALVRQMREGGWLGLGTRAITVETSWYNANLDLSTYVAWHVDISPGGRYQPHVVARSCRLYPYAATLDKLRMCMEFLFIVLLLAQWALELREITTAPTYMEYFHSFWNWLDLLNLVLFTSNLIVCMVYLGIDKSPYASISDASNQDRPDLSHITYVFNFASNFASFNIVFAYVKVFKYLQLYPSVNLLWRTLECSMRDTIPFLIVFSLFVCGFAIAGQWLFGFIMVEFSSFERSFTTLVQTLVSGLPYDDMKRSAPWSAPLFATAWVLMMAMVLVNMFVATLTEWFEQVEEDTKSVESKLQDRLGDTKIFSEGRDFMQWCHAKTGLSLFKGFASADPYGADSATMKERVRKLSAMVRDARWKQRDFDFVRRALLDGNNITLGDLLGNFDFDESKAYDFVCEINALASDMERYLPPAEAQDLDRIQKLQGTVVRLEDHLRKLRAALRDSGAAPLAPGQAAEGYLVDHEGAAAAAIAAKQAQATSQAASAAAAIFGPGKPAPSPPPMAPPKAAPAAGAIADQSPDDLAPKPVATPPGPAPQSTLPGTVQE